jgi:anthranilate phosphoribosyltransferase
VRCARKARRAVRGGDPAANAAILEGILVIWAIVNPAGGFVVAGLANYMASGIELAREQIDSGRALEKLRALQDYDAKVSV